MAEWSLTIFTESSVVTIVGAPPVDAVVAIAGRVTGVIGGGAMVVVTEGGVVEVVVLIGDGSVTLIRHPRLRWEAHCMYIII